MRLQDAARLSAEDHWQLAKDTYDCLLGINYLQRALEKRGLDSLLRKTRPMIEALNTIKHELSLAMFHSVHPPWLRAALYSRAVPDLDAFKPQKQENNNDRT